jgi:endoglucanase
VAAADASFWERPRRGANCQNRRVGPEYWRSAAAAGLEFIRLLPDAWPAARRDFLLGSADEFTSLDERDLAALVRALDEADRSGVKVVLGMLSLPGARWRQLNGDRDDGRLWREEKYQRQAMAFWSQLARRLRGHPALAAYNPLNEPHPEREFGFEEPGERFVVWRAKARGTAADLDRFNARVVEAIRAADPDTPILLDGWFYASPAGLEHLAPLAARHVLYAFHFYEPWEYTTFRVNAGRYAYPERMPAPGPARRWDAATLKERLAPVIRWSRRHAIPPARIVAAEYGVDRRVAGAEQYLADLVPLLDESGWHSAFYAFRSDGDWTGLDYELGTQRVDPRVWDAEKRGEDPERYKKRVDNPLWRILQRRPTAGP